MLVNLFDLFILKLMIHLIFELGFVYILTILMVKFAGLVVMICTSCIDILNASIYLLEQIK
jgi:hypothetical protein